MCTNEGGHPDRRDTRLPAGCAPRFFVNNSHYIAGSLNTRGWVVLCIRRDRVAGRLGVFVKNQFSRWAGVLVLGASSIVQLIMIPAYPFWSLSIFTLGILAIFGLVAYRSRISAAER